MRHDINILSASNSSYKYQYNGKELQTETGWNDYGWRQYMPEIGRWNGMDQLAENYYSDSPYAYVLNSPVMMFDPDGRVSKEWLNGIYNMSPTGKTTYSQFSSNGMSAWASYDSLPDGTASQFSAWLGRGGEGYYTYWTDGSYESYGGSEMVMRELIGNKVYIGDNNSNILSNWYSSAGKGNFGFGTAATTVGFVEGSFRLTNGIYNGNVWSPKYYPSGWAGGSRARITTYNFSKIGKGLGRASVVVGVVMDGVGVLNYKNNPNSPNAVHPNKAILNTVMGLIGSEGGTYGAIISTLYFGIDNFYPGGWVGASETAARTEENEQNMTGHPFFSNSSMKF